MTDFVLVDPKSWECDLHSVYSAYVGYFQVYNIPWYERSWGHFFESFDEFLGFSWPVITVTDAYTGRAHIVTKSSAINSFIKMIKTRFGETLPQAPNILQITPFETTQRRLRHVADYATYTRLHATLPAALLAALKSRVRAGEPKVVKKLWEKREKTFLSIDFELNERNEKTILEFGYAAVRCGHLHALGHWPPIPDTNYRKGHYIVAEHVDKIVNKHSPTYPWQYAFGDSQTLSKAKLPQVIQTVISSLASPDSETSANALVLMGHGIQGCLTRLEEMKIRLPNNLLILDTMVLERALYGAGWRYVMMDPSTEKPRANGTSLSLEKLLISFTLPPLPNHSSSSSSQSREGNHAPIILPQFTLHNSGNDALMTLFALQKLMEPGTAKVPTAQKVHWASNNNRMNGNVGILGPVSTGWAVQMAAMSTPQAMASQAMTAHGTPLLMAPSLYMGMPYGSMPSAHSLNPSLLLNARPKSSYTLAEEFGQMQLQSNGYGSGSSRERKNSNLSPQAAGHG